MEIENMTILVPNAPQIKSAVPADPIERLLYFIRERERVRSRRAKGKPWPWTDNPILREYRFCNVRREDDAVTRWIAEHWRAPNADDPDIAFAMVVARFINNPETLAEV